MISKFRPTRIREGAVGCTIGASSLRGSADRPASNFGCTADSALTLMDRDIPGPTSLRKPYPFSYVIPSVVDGYVRFMIPEVRLDTTMTLMLPPFE